MDQIIAALRKRHPKKGPNPGRDKDQWAQDYMNDIAYKMDLAVKLWKDKWSIEDICEKTGLYEASVRSLLAGKRKE